METVTQEHNFSSRQKPNSFSVLMHDAFLELQQSITIVYLVHTWHWRCLLHLGRGGYYTTAFLRTLFSKVLSTDRNYCLSLMPTKILLLTLMQKEFQQQGVPLKMLPGKICYRNMNSGINAVWTEICRYKHQKKQDRELKKACIANEDHTKAVTVSHPLFPSSLTHEENK